MKEDFIKKFPAVPDRAILDALPDQYFEKMDADDFKFHYESLLKLKSDTSRVYRSKGDIEEFIIHHFSTEKLLQNIQKTLGSSKSDHVLYRIFANRKADFILTAIYRNLQQSTRKAEFSFPVMEKLKNLSFTHTQENGKSIFHLKCNNTSRSTLFRNLHETFLKHNIFPAYTEMWELTGDNKQVKSFYSAEIYFDEIISEHIFTSVKNDLERYIQSYIKPMSIFDMIGPSMVGPSSSHTAGANKIGQIARNIIMAKMQFDNCLVSSVEVKLLGSFRDTGVGHRTPSAIGGGLWGFQTDDARMMKYGDPEFLEINGIDFTTGKVKFDGFKKGSIEEDEKYKDEKNHNIVEITARSEKSDLMITGFSIGGGNVEVRYVNGRLEKVLDGKSDAYFSDNKILSEKVNDHCTLVRKIIKDESCASADFSMPFNTFEELLDYMKSSKKKLVHVVTETEMKMQGCTESAIFNKMKNYWLIMQNSVADGLKSKTLSLLKLTGQDSGKMMDYISKNPLFNGIYGKAATYATAVNEINAKSGVIVACPTAGSCGILPGVLKSYDEIKKTDEKKILESLMIAGFLGMILFDDVTTAGADYGCQAEVGAGTAMAASALTYLEGGNDEMIIQAFILSLKNCLGLTCDPVAGLVEVPCVKRNGLYSSLAISAAFMALSGVRSFISPDEVIMVLKEAGEKLNSDFKETAGGGLAKTRDGKQVERDFELEVNRFFKS